MWAPRRSPWLQGTPRASSEPATMPSPKKQAPLTYHRVAQGERRNECRRITAIATAQATRPPASRPTADPDQRVGPLGDGDREQDRADVPADDLSADEDAGRRIGGEEGAGEELAGAEDQLRDAADEGQVQRQPVPPRPGSDPLRDADCRGGEQKADATDEEGADDVGGPEITGVARLRPRTAAAFGGTAHRKARSGSRPTYMG